MDPVRYRTTRPHAALDADASDIRASHDIAGGLIPTLPTSIGPAVLRPLSAYGARLRSVVLFDFDAGTKLVVQHPDNLAVAGRRHGLRTLPIHFATGVVERLTDVRLGVREGIRNLAGRLVAQVANLVPGVVQDSMLAALEPAMPARPLLVPILLLLDLGESLVPQLDRRLDLPAADQDGLVTIRGRDDRVDAKVHAYCWTRRLGLDDDLADDLHGTVAKPDFHHAPRHRDAVGYVDFEIASLAARQNYPTVAKTGRLVREKDLAVRHLPVRVLVRFSSLAERLGGLGGFEKVVKNHLDRLRVQSREETLDLDTPCRLGRPLPTKLADGRMPLDQPRPEAGSFLPHGGVDQPSLARRRKPSEFYCAVRRHGSNIPLPTRSTRGNGLKPQESVSSTATEVAWVSRAKARNF